MTLSLSFLFGKMATPSKIVRIKIVFSILVLKTGCQLSSSSRSHSLPPFPETGQGALPPGPWAHPSQTIGQHRQCGPVERAWAWVTSGKSVHLSEPQSPWHKMGWYFYTVSNYFV